MNIWLLKLYNFLKIFIEFSFKDMSTFYQRANPHNCVNNLLLHPLMHDLQYSSFNLIQLYSTCSTLNGVIWVWVGLV